MNKVIKLSELKHYGVKGQKWGIRKDYSKTKTLHRITRTKDETDVPDGYFTTSAKEAKAFKDFIKDHDNIAGTKIFSMRVKLKDLIITPSEKEEVDIQLDLLKDKKVKDLWADSLTEHALDIKGRQYRLSELKGYKERLDYLKTPESKVELGDAHEMEYALNKWAYTQTKEDMAEERKITRESILSSITVSSNKDSLQYFSMAVFGSPELRKIYRETIVSKGYNAVEDHWGQNEKKPYSSKLASPSAIMILDKNIFEEVKVK